MPGIGRPATRAEAVSDSAVEDLRQRLLGIAAVDVLIVAGAAAPYGRELVPFSRRLSAALQRAGWANRLVFAVSKPDRELTVLTSVPNGAGDVIARWLVDQGIAATRRVDGIPGPMQITIGRPRISLPRLLMLPSSDGIIRTITTSEPVAGSASSPVAAASDGAVRARLLERIGDINAPARSKPLVTLEEFFVGNDDAPSIGYNLPGGGPGPQAFFTFLRALRDRVEVTDVLIEVKDVEGTEAWPATDTIHVITSASLDEARTWCPDEFAPDEWTVAERLGPPDTEPFEIPVGQHAVALFYD